MRLPPPSSSVPISQQNIQAVEFCVIKPTAIGLYSLKERLVLQRVRVYIIFITMARLLMNLKELPNAQGLRYARRSGRLLCAADSEYYCMVDLAAAASFQLLPIEQVPNEDPNAPRVRPRIAVVGEDEFLVISSMGQTTMGVFINENGDPVRGTLEWPSYPESICKWKTFP